MMQSKVTHSIPFKILCLGIPLLISACAPDPNRSNYSYALNDLDNQERTGAEKRISRPSATGTEVVSVPYTISGAPDVFNGLRTKLGTTNDTVWAKSVKNVAIKNDEKEFSMSVEFDPSYKIPNNKLEFRGQLTQQNDSKNAHNLVAVSDSLTVPAPQSVTTQTQKLPAYTADVTSYGDGQVYEVTIKEVPKQTDSKNAKHIGFVYRTSTPDIELRPGSADTPLVQDLQKSLQGKAEYVSVNVVGGSSYSVVSTPTNFRIETDNVDTQTGTMQITKTNINNNQDAVVKLVGNDPKTGSLMLQVDDKLGTSTILVENKATPAFITKSTTAVAQTNPKSKQVPPQTPTSATPKVQPGKPPQVPANGPIAKPNEQKPPTVPALAPTPDSAPIPAPNVPPLTPKDKSRSGDNVALFYDILDTTPVVAIRESFESYEDNPEVIKRANQWIGKDSSAVKCEGGDVNQPNLKSMQQFIAHAKPIAGYLAQVTNACDITAEIGYIMLFESNYLMSSEYNAKAIAPAPHTALGPWGINNPTAKSIKLASNLPFNISATRSQPQDIDQDDRTYFMNSTYMACLRFKQMLKTFPQDPVIAIMAYHAGPGSRPKSSGAAGVVDDAADELKKSYGQVTFGEILKYRKQTQVKPNCQYINYALSFLATRTIGQNLEKHKEVKDVEATKSTNFMIRLVNPKGPLPISI